MCHPQWPPLLKCEISCNMIYEWLCICVCACVVIVLGNHSASWWTQTAVQGSRLACRALWGQQTFRFPWVSDEGQKTPQGASSHLGHSEECLHLIWPLCFTFSPMSSVRHFVNNLFFARSWCCLCHIYSFDDDDENWKTAQIRTE